ncbi:MAG TPA: PDZ domain-containing protein [Polyangia bacterium]|nr:PDZ domain-containing protein [Polyangia bacterium]
MLTTPDAAAVAYRVSMSEPASHEFEVQIDVPALGRATVDLVFPAWAPGSYLVRDFVRHVYRLAVTDGRGRALPAQRLEKARWRVEADGRAFRVRYRVFAFEQSVRTSFLDDSHAYWNGTSLFFFVDGELARPCRVTVVPPPGARWRVDTALPPARGARTSSTFEAADFDELVDSPFEAGTHARRSFRVGGVPFELALYGRTNADVDRLVDVLRRVSAATGRIFGGRFPFRRYLYIVHALPVGSGGLEHRASVTMDIAGLSFEDEAGYHRFADLAAHELFHAWNVKRLRDATLGPFDYTRENYTRLLWLHEGFTDYLANVIVLRAGITKEKHFWKWIAEDWPKYASRPGRNETPLSELSFEAWIKLYKPAENHVNRAVSYYEKGLWVGMALDLTLRLRTGGKRGLPELFHLLWRDLDGGAVHVSEAAVRAAARKLAGARAGSSAARELDAFFDRYVNGTDELPLPELWRRAGLAVREQAEWQADDVDDVRAARARAWTGLALHEGRTTVRNVVPGSPAWRAGLTFNDELVAVDGARVTAATFAKRVGDRRPGERATIAYFRRDELATATLTLVESPERKLVLAPDAKASGLAKAVRDGWLGAR